MTVINGYIAESSAYSGNVNANLSADMHGFALAWWPPHSSAMGAAPKGSLITSWPVEANGKEISGFTAGSYVDDFYYRVHIIPAELNLGNIVSTQTTSVFVWNAWLTPVTLIEISGLDDGILLSGEAEPPLNFTALQIREYDVSITTDGPAVLTAQLQWQFNNGDVGDLRITGNRISAFPFLPDWADGITERLNWATSIAQSRSGAEQRRALRLAPRREFEATLLIAGRERQAFDLALFGWSSHAWALPIWPEIQLLTTTAAAGAFIINCSTANLDFKQGGLAILLGETAFQYETVEVLTITSTQLTLKRELINTWQRGSRLYPVRIATMQQAPELTRQTDEYQSCTVNFTIIENCDFPAVMPTTTYRSFPVFDDIPDESTDLTSQYKQLLLTLDNGSAAPSITDTANLSFASTLHRWFLAGRAERANFRSFLYALCGRQKAVWVPTHAADLTVVASVTSVATTIDIAAIGYTRYAQMKTGRKDIRILLRNGTVFCRRITGSVEINADVERIQIDTALGVLVAPNDVLRVSWLMLMRGDSDTVEIKHETDSQGLALSQQMFRGVRDDEL